MANAKPVDEEAVQLLYGLSELEFDAKRIPEQDAMAHVSMTIDDYMELERGEE